MASDDARSARIVAHMNAEHQASLALYLRRFAHLPATHPDVCSSPVNMASISTSAMTLVATGSSREYVVPFNPPLASLADARVRLVAMDEECRQVLRLPQKQQQQQQDNDMQHASHPVVIREFLPPSAIELLLWSAVGVMMLLMLYLPWLPDGWFKTILATIWRPVLAIHVAEAVWMHYSRLHRYGVPAGSGLWWIWTVTTFVGGYGGFRRFDRLVARETSKTKKL